MTPVAGSGARLPCVGDRPAARDPRPTAGGHRAVGRRVRAADPVRAGHPGSRGAAARRGLSRCTRRPPRAGSPAGRSTSRASWPARTRSPTATSCTRRSGCGCSCRSRSCRSCCGGPSRPGVTAGGDLAPATAAGRLAVPGPVPGLADDACSRSGPATRSSGASRPWPWRRSARGAAPFVAAQAEPRRRSPLFGIRDRSWWLGHGRSSSRCAVPFGAMWLDWITAVVNSRGGGSAVLGAGGADAAPAARRLAGPDTPPLTRTRCRGSVRHATGRPARQAPDSDQQVLMLGVGRDVLGHELAVGLDAQTPSADVGQHVLGEA